MSVQTRLWGADAPSDNAELTPPQKERLINQRVNLSFEYQALNYQLAQRLALYRHENDYELLKSQLAQQLQDKKSIEQTLQKMEQTNKQLIALYEHTKIHDNDELLNDSKCLMALKKDGKKHQEVAIELAKLQTREKQQEKIKEAIKNKVQEIKQLNAQLITLYKHTGIHDNKDLLKDKDTLDNPHKKPARHESVPFTLDEEEFAPQESVSFLDSRASIPPKITFGTKVRNLFKKVRTFVTEGNPLRFFITRFRRFLVNVNSRITNGTPFDTYFFAPALRWVAWIFLLPRLIVNTYNFLWNVIPHKGLSPEQLSLTAWQRAKILLRDVAFEWSNDWIWVPGNMLTCFLLLGALNMPGLILGVALFAWDLVRNIVRAGVELLRLRRLIKVHEEQGSDPDFIAHLKQHWTYQKKFHAFSCFNAFGVTVLTFFASGIIALPIVVPIVASVLLLILTVVAIYMNFFGGFKKMLPNSPTVSGLEDSLALSATREELSATQQELYETRTIMRRLSAPQLWEPRLSGSFNQLPSQPPHSPKEVIAPRRAASLPNLSDLSDLSSFRMYACNGVRSFTVHLRM